MVKRADGQKGGSAQGAEGGEQLAGGMALPYTEGGSRRSKGEREREEDEWMDEQRWTEEGGLVGEEGDGVGGRGGR